MLCWGQKSIKIVPTSFQKQLSNRCSNLHRFESQLDSILGGFWGSRWSPIGSKSLQKSIPKTIKKMITFWIAPRSNFGGFWPQLGPQERKPLFNFWSIFRSWGPLGPKISPRPLQEASWDPQDPSKSPLGTPKTPPRGLLGPILEDFGLQLGSF